MRVRKMAAMVLTVLCLCAGFDVSASAETAYSFIGGGISPAYEIARNSTSSLSIGGKTAYCKSEASGDNAVSITVEQTLEKYSGWLWIWDNVDDASWSKTVNDNAITMSNTKSGLDSGTYRLRSVFTLTSSSGKTETITVYSDEKSVG